jgi:GH15 family glucan-1,4-alpha-glucosidase
VASRIEDYALISDRLSAGLIGRDGSLDWLCFPRFDSDAVFAALLGTEENGHWRLAPRDGPATCTSRRYRGDTMILETEWAAPGGTVRVIDFMPERDEAPDVVRIVEGIEGRVDMRSELRFRFGYGDVIPWVRSLEGMLVAIAGPDAVWLASDVAHRGRDFTSFADFTVGAGQRESFVLTWNPSYLRRPHPVDPMAALVATERFWQGWSDTCTYDGPYREPVLRSLLTLKALTYAPTGGIIAAATAASMPSRWRTQGMTSP